ncbi:TonB-dependent siderophore receptor [Acinetobacter puyangensis]|uniref:TonB-dependent siderophore receptor n=1 Tax=Acinetobacter puyangensis TaxID=1096779 RepID=UPI003A4E5F22
MKISSKNIEDKLIDGVVMNMNRQTKKHVLGLKRLSLVVSAMLYAGTVFANNSLAVDLPAQSLGESLHHLAKQSGAQILFSNEITSKQQAKSVKGQLTVEQALQQLLQGTGLTIKDNSNNSFSIVPATQQQSRDMGQLKPIDVNAIGTANRDSNVAQLPVITVNADQNTTEGTGLYTTGKMRTATKLDLSIRETPQSVTVISNQFIEDKKIDDFDTLMNHVVGVGGSKGNMDNRSYYYSRGFYLDYYQMDSIPMFLNNYVMNNINNMDKFDRVEVVKGSNGLTSGAGNPAASINMVRKRANSKEFTGSVDVSAGTWDTYKIKTDISTPLNDDGSIRGRLVASHKETDTFKDRVHHANDLLYGVVDADITDNTTISAGASYEKANLDGDSTNLPAFYSDGTKTNFERSKNFSPDWSYWDTERKTYFLDIKHHFENNILLNIVYTNNDIETDNNYGYINIWGGSLNKDGSGLEYRQFGNWLNNTKEDNVDIYISVPFNLANRDHEIIAGFQYNKQKSDYSRKNLSQYTNIANFFIQNGSEIPYINIPNLQPRYENVDIKQTAFYVTGKFEIVDDLKLIVGGRLTNYDYERYTYSSQSTLSYDANNEFTPFVGLTYDIDGHHSAYASYTDIFKPQDARGKDDKLLDPILGKNYEIGIKGEYFDKNLNVGLALFRIEQDNVAESTGNRNPITGNSIYEAKDGVVSKGIELDISGKITDQWDLSLGFANFEAKDANNDKVNTIVARNNINIFTKYSINDFSFGAGVNWKSEGYNGEVKQDTYATVDVMASYKFNKSLSGQLNINNLFDETYYAGYGENVYMYGEPVNGMLSLKYQF